MEFTLCVLAVLSTYSTILDLDAAPTGSEELPLSSQFRDIKDDRWYKLGQKELQNALKKTPIVKKAKNVIVVIGDGMGVSTVTATRKYLSQLHGLPLEDSKLSFEHLPHVALSKTYTTNKLTADSSATATAIMTGVKTTSRTVGVTEQTTYTDCLSGEGNYIKSLFHHALEQGKWTGIVTTTPITHATPASAYAHTPKREWEVDWEVPEEHREVCRDIAQQLVDDDLNRKIRVLLGGGRNNFLPMNETDPEEQTKQGRRADGRYLIQDWQRYKREEGVNDSQYRVVYKESELENLDIENTEYLLGLFSAHNMEYETFRSKDAWGQPSLVSMATTALRLLQKSEEGYFLLVEGGLIDKGHHLNKAHLALNETAVLGEAVSELMRLTSEDDTLLIVTADHSHAFNIVGYPDIETSIFGSDEHTISRDGKPYNILAYANGPGFYKHRTVDGVKGSPLTERANISQWTDHFDDVDYVSDAAYPGPKEKETHGGEDVAIYARGPMSHLFHGTHEQSYIGHVIDYAACLRSTEHAHCHSSQSLSPRVVQKSQVTDSGCLHSASMVIVALIGIVYHVIAICL